MKQSFEVQLLDKMVVCHGLTFGYKSKHKNDNTRY